MNTQDISLKNEACDLAQSTINHQETSEPNIKKTKNKQKKKLAKAQESNTSNTDTSNIFNTFIMSTTSKMHYDASEIDINYFPGISVILFNNNSKIYNYDALTKFMLKEVEYMKKNPKLMTNLMKVPVLESNPVPILRLTNALPMTNLPDQKLNGSETKKLLIKLKLNDLANEIKLENKDHIVSIFEEDGLVIFEARTLNDMFTLPNYIKFIVNILRNSYCNTSHTDEQASSSSSHI